MARRVEKVYECFETVPIINKRLAGRANTSQHFGAIFESEQEVPDIIYTIVNMLPMSDFGTQFLLSFKILLSADC